jgi:DNA-binding CsgD family transcriptional regulator
LDEPNASAETVMSILQQAYGSVELSAAQWLDGLLEALLPLIDQGQGVHGYFVDASNRSEFLAWGFACHGSPEPFPTACARFDGWLANAPLAVKRGAHLFAPYGSHATLPPDIFPPEELAAAEAGHGYRDLVGLNALDAAGRGCALAAPSFKRLDALPMAALELWGRIAVHVAAAARLQRHLEHMRTSAFSAAEAVLSPSGKVEHAVAGACERVAMAALRDAAVRLERARAPATRANPLEALRLWQALVQQRWTLVDQFERDGRRYLVAVPNETRPAPHTSLTEQERRVIGGVVAGHSNKLIAYELGVSPSTVATHLSRAMGKLGVHTRVELVRRLTAEGDV